MAINSLIFFPYASAVYAPGSQPGLWLICDEQNVVERVRCDFWSCLETTYSVRIARAFVGESRPRSPAGEFGMGMTGEMAGTGENKTQHKIHIFENDHNRWESLLFLK